MIQAWLSRFNVSSKSGVQFDQYYMYASAEKIISQQCFNKI